MKKAAVAIAAALILQVLFPAAPAFAAWNAQRSWRIAGGPAEVSAMAAQLSVDREATEGDFGSGRLVLWSERLEDDLGAETVIFCPSCGEYVLQYASPEAAEQACALLRERYGEASCFPDIRIAAEPEAIGWGAGTMGMEGVLNAEYPLSGNATVAVIDSGCATDHPLLRERISPYSYDFVSGTGVISDWSEEGGAGHGTAVAGVIADSTPSNVEILILRVFSEKGYASSLGFANAMLYALEKGADVVNMSIGVEAEDDTEWDIPLQRLYNAGIPFICSAGNESNSVRTIYPAYSPYTIAVSAVNERLGFSSFSNYGSEIDFCAPGENIVTADSSTGGRATASGTSISAPYVSSAAAYIKLLHPDYSVGQVYAVLRSYALDLGSTGKDNSYGWGMPLISSYLADEYPGVRDKLLYGSAREKDGVIELTDFGSNQRAMVAWNDPISTEEGFTVSLEFRAEPGGELPGEGIGIQFSSVRGTPPGSSGSGGINLRESPDMVAVALDSHQPIGLWFYGKYIEIVSERADRVRAISAPCDEVCDGAWHQLEIEGTRTTLSVKLDGTVEAVAARLSLPERAYLSLTAATGSYTARHQVRNLRFTAAPAESEARFYDVIPGAYYEEAVAWALRRGITGGVSDNSFGPELICTRAQAVTFLWRSAGSPAPLSGDPVFADVPGDSYYFEAVSWAVENGVTGGISPSEFGPELSCTRAQIVTFLCRALDGESAGVPPFDDVPEDAYYAGPVGWAVENGVTSGTAPGQFSPDLGCTRAQIVTFLYRANGGV